jgi:hypothetical protein
VMFFNRIAVHTVGDAPRKAMSSRTGTAVEPKVSNYAGSVPHHSIICTSHSSLRKGDCSRQSNNQIHVLEYDIFFQFG